MIRYRQPALLTLTLILSAGAALGQKTEGIKSAPPSTGTAKPAPAQDANPKDVKGKPSTQLNTRSTADLSYNPISFKHAPDSPMLRQAIDVDMRNSTIRQAAEAITRASGISIRVDDKVPTDARLTVTAQKIPLTTVLEAIARQTELDIEPEEKGILLRNWPVLEVNGEKKVYVGRNEPWSDLWDKLPKSANPMGGPPLVGNTFNPFSTVGTFAQNPLAGGAGGGTFFIPTLGMNVDASLRANPLFMPAVNGFSLTALNEHSFVVAEAILGANNENGVLLTVYRLEGARILEISRVYHKLASGGNRGTATPVPGREKDPNNLPTGTPPVSTDKKPK